MWRQSSWNATFRDQLSMSHHSALFIIIINVLTPHLVSIGHDMRIWGHKGALSIPMLRGFQSLSFPIPFVFSGAIHPSKMILEYENMMIWRYKEIQGFLLLRVCHMPRAPFWITSCPKTKHPSVAHYCCLYLKRFSLTLFLHSRSVALYQKQN